MVPLAENTKPEADKQKQCLRTLSWSRLTQQLIHDSVLGQRGSSGGGVLGILRAAPKAVQEYRWLGRGFLLLGGEV